MRVSSGDEHVVVTDRLGVMNRLIPCLLVASVAACSSEPLAPLDDPGRDRHPSSRRSTVAVADAAEGLVTVIDLEFGEVASTIDLPGPARLGASYTGNLGIAIGEDGARFFTSGVAIIDHTGEGWEDQEHLHIYKYPPKRLDFMIAGEGAGVAIGRDDRIAVFFPGTAASGATTAIFEEEPVIQGESPEVTTIAGEHHHGLAVPLGARALVTIGAGAANAVGLFDETGPLDTVACSDVHGVALVADQIAFGCAEGLSTVTVDGDALIGEVIAAADTRPHRIASHIDRADVAADAASGLALYEPATSTARSLPLPFGACDFGFEPALGDALVLLGDDGAVHVVDPDTGAVTATIAVTAGFSCDDDVRPRLALAPEVAFVTLPGEGALLEVNLTAAAVGRRHELGGVPHEVVVLGIDPRNRNAGGCSTCQ